MRVLITAPFFPICTGLVFKKAFEEIGWEVITAGPSQGAFIPWAGGMLLDGQGYIPDAEVKENTKITVQDLELMYGKFDLVLQNDANFVLKSNGSVPNVCFLSDNHVISYPHVDEFDYIFGAHSWANHHDHPRFHWLVGGWEPHCYDMGIPRPFDVALVGNVYDSRFEAIKVMLRKNVTMVLGWGQLNENFNLIYNSCKMAVVVPCFKDLSGRVFNHMRQGNLVIMERGVVDAPLIGLKEGVHYLAFGTGGEYDLGTWWTLMEAIQFGRDPHLRKVITDRAKAFVEPWSWVRTVHEMLQVCGLEE